MFFHETVVYDTRSALTRYKVVDMVYEGRQARLLFAGQRSSQSGIATDDQPELLFDYNQRFIEIIESRRPHSILLIGGGAFTLPTAILRRLTHTTIDVIELDPVLPTIAETYFGLQADPRLSIYIGDGRHFIDTTTTQYDIIILDAFSDYDIPLRLISSQAIEQYIRLLHPDGLFMMNFIAKYQTQKQTFTHELVSSFQSQFPVVSLYPADPFYPAKEEQNLLLLASEQEITQLEYLQSAEVQLATPPTVPPLQDP